MYGYIFLHHLWGTLQLPFLKCEYCVLPRKRTRRSTKFQDTDLCKRLANLQCRVDRPELAFQEMIENRQMRAFEDREQRILIIIFAHIQLTKSSEQYLDSEEAMEHIRQIWDRLLGKQKHSIICRVSGEVKKSFWYISQLGLQIWPIWNQVITISALVKEQNVRVLSLTMSCSEYWKHRTREVNKLVLMKEIHLAEM